MAKYNAERYFPDVDWEAVQQEFHKNGWMLLSDNVSPSRCSLFRTVNALIYAANRKKEYPRIVACGPLVVSKEDENAPLCFRMRQVTTKVGRFEAWQGKAAERKRLEESKGWALEELLECVRRLASLLKPLGFGVGVTGSVLLQGSSEHDGDIIIYPLDASDYHLCHAYSALEHFGMKRQFDHYEMLSIWRKKRSNDVKHVEVWSYNNKRVDIFFLR